jgi:hypothetical protein
MDQDSDRKPIDFLRENQQPKWLMPAITVVLVFSLSYGFYAMVMSLRFERRLAWWEAVLAFGAIIVVFSISVTAVFMIGVGLHHGLGAIGASLNKWVLDRKDQGKEVSGLMVICRLVWLLCGGVYGLFACAFTGFFIGGWIFGGSGADKVGGGLIGAIVGGIGGCIVFGMRYMLVGGPPEIEPPPCSKWQAVAPLNPERQRKA